MARMWDRNAGATVRRRVWQARKRISAAILPSGLGVVSVQHGARVAAADVRRESDRLWGVGKRVAAVEVLRRGAAEPGNGALWWSLYGRLQAMGRYESASLVLRNAVDHNPANLRALEMLVEDLAIRPAPGTLQLAYDRLSAVIPKHPALHRTALFFCVPAGHAALADVLRSSSDPVVREVIDIVGNPRRAELLAAEDSELSPLVRAIASMVSGNHRAAVSALVLVADEDLPIDGIRVIVRRLLLKGNNKRAHDYLKVMRRVSPDDGWVRDKLKATRDKVMSPYELSKKGFPFKRRRPLPSYDPIPDRALYLLHNSLPHHSAGYATRTHGLLTAVRGLGWDVHAATRLGYPYDMPKFEEFGELPAVEYVDGVPYHRLSTTNHLEMKRPIQAYVARYAAALRVLAEQEKPFVIHAASNHWNGLAAVQVANQLGIDSIYEVRGLWEVTRGSRDPEWAKGGMYRFMARMEADAAMNATQVLTITHALADELVRRGVDSDKITVVPNGVNADRFQPKPRNHELAKKLGLEGKTVIGYIGSVLDYEGLGLLIDAAEQLHGEKRNFAVMIVGDGAELGRFQSEVEERRLSELVTFTGRVPHEEVEDYYSLVDIAPFPRLPLPVCEMVSPLKPFEAMAMEKAVVASDVAALAEIVQDGVTGLLHAKGDAEDLAAKLAYLLDDAEARARLAAAGRTWVLEERQWTDLGRRVADDYSRLSGRSA